MLLPSDSSLANGLGVYDGISGSFANLDRWVLPYFIGRLYFGDKEGMRELAVGIAIGGIIWVLPCLFEMRMSPMLHGMVYGIQGMKEHGSVAGAPFVFFSTGPGTGDVDDGLVADGGMALVVRVAQAARRLSPWGPGSYPSS